MKKEANIQKPKCRKDFYFLIDKDPEFIGTKIAKYKLSQGEGNELKELLDNHFNIFFSYAIYDYSGKLLQKNPISKISTVKKEQNEELKKAILSMKIKEKSWFNFCNEPVPSAIQQQQELDKRSGYHYQITVSRIEYLNSDKIEIMRTINLQNREKASILIDQKKYYQASNALKKIIKATQKVNKKIHPQQQLGQIQSININAKLKYLDCYFKIQNTVIQISLQKFTKRVVEWLNQKSINHSYSKWLSIQNSLQRFRKINKKSSTEQNKKQANIEE